MRNAKPLTEKQKDILNFIESYIEEFGYPPSIRDIQNNCDISFSFSKSSDELCWWVLLSKYGNFF